MKLCIGKTSNYAFKPIAEQALRSNQTIVPQRLNAALDVMEITLNNSTPRDDLLRRIGRNVVNFQYLESILRNMLPSLASEGTVTSLKSNLTATVRRHKKSSLGDLTEKFLENIFSRLDQSPSPADGPQREATFRTSVRVESTPEEEAEQRKAILKLVVERNRLIHRDALSVNLNSAEECALLSARLDEQNQRIRAQLVYLNALRQAQKEALEEFIRFMQSDEFVTALRGARDDV